MVSEKLIPTKEVMKLTSLSRTSIHRLQRNQDFPEAIKISAGRVAFRESSIREWIDAKISNGAIAA